MRIHLFGAVLAFDYMLAGWLRQRGIDAHYFYNFKRNEADYPWWEDAAFDREHPPEWCHFHPFRVPYLYNAPLATAGRAFVRDINRDADLIFAVGDGAFLAHHYTRPYTVWSCGFEVEEAVPSPIRWGALAGRLAGRREPVGLQRALNGGHVRRMLRNADSVISVMEFQVPTYLKWAGVTDNVQVLPMLYDCTRYRPMPDADLIRRYAADDVVFFLPTRHSYGTWSTNDKGADKVIAAFARLVRGGASRARLVLIEKGERVAESRAAVAASGIEGQVEWLPPMPKATLKSYYSLPNVVVLDQFPNEDTMDPRLHAALRLKGSRGSIFAEAMCIGAPVVSSVGVEWMASHGGATFVEDACTVDEIERALATMAAVPIADRAARGNRNTQWALRHLHWESTIDGYIGHFESLIARSRRARSRSA